MVSLLVAVIIAALVFDYINGFHDAANAIATSVSTGVLTMRVAVTLAAILNVAGALTGTAVAKTISSGFANAHDVTQLVVLGALIGASIWNLITWVYGIPSSSSHALIGGLAGAVTAHSGISSFNWTALGEKVVVPLVVSPALGFGLAFTLMVVLAWAFRRVLPRTAQTTSRRMQLVSACMMAFSHGSNDAQKVMGIITLALTAYVVDHPGTLPAWFAPPEGHVVPLWVKLACALAIGLGTFAGGKRIIKTMGSKLIRITPMQGFAAEASGAATILMASHLGVPVSTTHCINTAILGAGASKRLSAVRWGVAGNILVAWVLTIPLSAVGGYISMRVCDALFG
jgi:PiT family inorganic phosphate transporter